MPARDSSSKRLILVPYFDSNLFVCLFLFGISSREQFTNFMEVLAEESSGSSLVWSRQFEDFWSKLAMCINPT